MKFGRGRRRVIMVIEDIEETCHGIEPLLTSDDYSVVIAKDGERYANYTLVSVRKRC